MSGALYYCQKLARHPPMHHTDHNYQLDTSCNTKHNQQLAKSHATALNMSLQGVKHTTMSDKIRIDICKHHIANPKLTQKELVSWLQQKHYVKVSQGTVINTFKWSTELIQLDPEVANQNSKRHRLVKYPMMKDALVAWFHGHQYRINFSGELVCEAAQQMHGKLHPDHDHSFKFFNGWLEAFKKRNNIRSRRRFGERGRVNKQIIYESLPRLCETLDKFE